MEVTQDNLSAFHLFQRVRVLKGRYAGKEGVIERILHDGKNKGLWIELEGVFGLKVLQANQVRVIKG